MTDLVVEKKRENQLLEADMKEVITMLSGSYSIANQKPGLRFYEGDSDIKELYNETLEVTDEILAFNGGTEEYFHQHLVGTIHQRLIKGVKKKIINEDTPLARKHEIEYSKIPQNDALTEVKFISTNKYPFESSVIVYNDVSVFLTLNKDTKLGFMIKSQEIANIHKSLFWHVWSELPEWDKKI